MSKREWIKKIACYNNWFSHCRIWYNPGIVCRIWRCDACGIMAGNIRYVSCEYRGSIVHRGGDYDLVCSHI